MSESPRLRSGSVRVRATVGVIIVLALVLAGLSVAVAGVFTVQSGRNLSALLDGRAQLARQLARTGVGPQQIVNRITTDGIQAQLTLRTGTVLGTPSIPGSSVRTVQTRLVGPGRVNGATLMLSVDTSLLDGAQNTLRRLLVAAAVIALVISGTAVALVVRFTLRPLSRVAHLARGLTEGRRGERLRPERNDTEIGQVATALDEMLDELEGAEARARGAEEQMRVFLADAAHELRTPIAGLQAATETLLHAGPGLAESEREQLQVLVVREARRAGRLVSDLLTTARLDAGPDLRRTPTDLTVLARAEVERSRLLAPDRSVEVIGEPAIADVDPDAISGVLRNLVDNGGRAAGPGGRVDVRVSATGEEAVVEVSDTGPGIAAADRDRVFDRLVRLDASRATDDGGSGLGLAISRSWARAHGGDLVCTEPRDGVGARFVLTLPQHAPVIAEALGTPCALIDQESEGGRRSARTDTGTAQALRPRSRRTS